ncbi:MAG: adenylosuccinate lyase [Pseudomonadota bacterium]
MSNDVSLLAISAIDGRYRSKCAELAPITSEYGLMRWRVQVECEWLIFLAATPAISEMPALGAEQENYIRDLYQSFDTAGAQRIKAVEATTNHDVKAVEYFVKEHLRSREDLSDLVEWVHFACTSEDINNTAYGLMLRNARDDVLLPLLSRLVQTLEGWAEQYASVPMLSRTHGQTASPTTLGKEFKNVAARLARQHQQLAAAEILGKFNGAVGNYNAHISAYPEQDWPALSADFLTRLGLTQNPWTTQIEPHDYVAEVFHILCRINQIVLDFDRDIWSYIAIEYFKQKKVEGETGSSTMPHKVNPIDFENSEGNLGVANALLEHMAAKLTVSRWQRDLSDSTVLRNIGSALAHCVIAYQATLKGMGRLEVNEAQIAADLGNSWEVLAEPVQTVMRKYGMEEPYERLKAATRGAQMNEALFKDILEQLELPAAAHAELKDLRPDTYVGAAARLSRS